MTIELVLLMLMLGIGMKTSYLSPDTRFELLDLKDRSFYCQAQSTQTEPGHLYPGKGKATNYSADRLMYCSKRIFSNRERHSFINFITASSTEQARRIAHSLHGMLRQNFGSADQALRATPLSIAVNETDPAIQNYLHDVFVSELAAVLGPRFVRRTRPTPGEILAPPVMRISLREVDAADLLFDAKAEFRSNRKELQWQL